MKITSFLISFFLCIASVSAKDNAITYLRLSDSRTLDPGKTQDLYSGDVNSNIFEGLVYYDNRTNEIKPCLAEKWERSKDGKTWTFYLKRGIYFHNGIELDSESVVYSFQKRKNNKNEYIKWQLFFPHIRDVRALDKYTLVIILNKPFAPFLTALTDPVAFIVLKNSLEMSDYKPIGTGPFKFSSWKKKKHLILDRNENYREKPAGVARVIFKIVTNPTSRVSLLKAGKADLLEIRSELEYNEFLGRKDLYIIPHLPNGTFSLGFNTRKEPFNKVEVRRAFAHMVNKKVLIRQTFQDFAIPAVSPLPPQIPGYNPNLDHHQFSIKRSRELLEIAGYKNGFSCNIYYQKADLGEQRIVESFVRNARQLNIQINKKPFSFQELMEKLKKGEHDLYIRGWIAGPDPDIYLFSKYTLKGHGNWAFYDNPSLEKLLQLGRETLDQKKRLAFYQEALAIIHEEVPVLPLYHSKHLHACSVKVKNVYLSSNSMTIFKDAVKER